MDLGGEDSTRFLKKVKKEERKDLRFEDLLIEEDKSFEENRKRVKQGDNSKSWMNTEYIQKGDSGLRRKDAEDIPRKEKNLKNLLAESTTLNGKESLSSLKKIAILNGRSLENLNDLNVENHLNRNVPKRKFSLNDSLPAKVIEKGLLKTTSKIKYLKDENTREIAFDLKLKNNKSIEKDNFKFKDEKLKIKNEKEPLNVFRKDLNGLDQVDKINDNQFAKFERPKSHDNLLKNDKLIENEKIENFSSKSDSIKLNENLELKNSKLNHDVLSNIIQLDSTESSSDQIRLAQPVFRHIANNILQNYSISLDKLINSFDRISFKSIESGFALKMKLYPEQLGELELHLKKEGLNISLIAFVMNDEAKQVMMNDMKNLSNFFMNQGYNLEQIMVEVKNDSNSQNFENFDKIIAENNSNIKLNSKEENSVGKRDINQFGRFNYLKGLGRLVNKYV